MKNQIQTTINHHYQNYEITPELQEQIIGKLNHNATTGRKISRGYRHIIAAAATFVLVLLTSVTALGAVLPSVNAVISQVSPGFAQLLMPVTAAVEDNDIEVRIVSAIADDQIILAVLEVEDFKGDRIKEWMIPQIESDAGDFATSTFGNYDEETGIVSYFWIGEYINSDRAAQVTLSVDFVNGSGYSADPTDGSDLDGEWQISFIPEQIESQVLKTDFIVKGANVDSCVITPLSLKLTGSEYIDLEDIYMELTMKDGSTHYIGPDFDRTDRFTGGYFGNTWNDKPAIHEYAAVIFFGEVIDLEQIETIVVSDVQLK